jgi:hypothetical protein
MAKRKEEPAIPADLMAMTLEQLEKESARHDSGDIRDLRETLVAQRDEAQEHLESLSKRRHDITRAMIAKMEKQIKP